MKQWKIQILGCALVCWLGGNSIGAATMNTSEPEGEAAATQAVARQDTVKPAASVGKAEMHTNKERGEYLVWTLADIRKEDPTAEDFRLGGVALGDDFAALTAAFGAPERRTGRDAAAEWHWPGVTARVQRALPYDAATAQRIGVDPVRALPGVAQLTVETDAYPTARGIAVGNSRENIIRVYGAPTEVRWDPQTGVTNYIYRVSEANRAELVFRVKQLQVEAITLAYAPRTAEDPVTLLPQPATLAGIALQRVFTPPTYTDWEYRIEQDHVQAWLYPDFGVTIDKDSGRVERVYLRSNHVATAKGIALGDSFSTVVRAYGTPVILTELEKDHLRLCYYRLPQRDVYLVFVVNTKQDQVEDIILTTSTIRQVMPREARYGLAMKEKE